MSTAPRTRVTVDPDVLAGLEAVRASGVVNMFDRPAVARLALDAGHYATALWVTENRAAYAEGIFAGFIAGPPPPANTPPRADWDRATDAPPAPPPREARP